MYFDGDENVSVFDFDELADHLVEQGSEFSPAEIHGCLTGLLTGGLVGTAERGLDAMMQTLDVVPHGELADRVMELYVVTDAALRDEEFSFFPLLPEDEAQIEIRTVALASWCGGFLAGLAQAGAQGASPPADWSSDGKEILQDIGALAQATVDEDLDEDESEENYMEIYEYLRFAVLNLFLENSTREGFVELDRGPSDPLH
ncbi:MAG: UPF0149 family protein [Gammaproteobacteria bacterium]|nr:UPF0149 family protein [Gammaproteobacteria bacterium]